jgi:hypothetical protein
VLRARTRKQLQQDLVLELVHVHGLALRAVPAADLEPPSLFASSFDALRQALCRPSGSHISIQLSAPAVHNCYQRKQTHT